jgi:hypothetical protein
MDKDPLNEAFVLPCSRGTAWTRPSPWTRSRRPARRTGETSTSPGWIEGNFPRTDPRPDASLGWPSHSASWTASCTSTPHQASCSGACPSPRGASTSETTMRACADIICFIIFPSYFLRISIGLA